MARTIVRATILCPSKIRILLTPYILLTETFQYTHFKSCHPTGAAKGFVRGEALRLLRTNSSKNKFEENIQNFKTRLISRDYPEKMVGKILSEVEYKYRKTALEQKKRTDKKLLPFVT